MEEKERKSKHRQVFRLRQKTQKKKRTQFRSKRRGEKNIYKTQNLHQQKKPYPNNHLPVKCQAYYKHINKNYQNLTMPVIKTVQIKPSNTSQTSY